MKAYDGASLVDNSLKTVAINERLLKTFGRMYEIMASRIDKWRGKSERG